MSCQIGWKLQALPLLLSPVIPPVLRPDDHLILKYYVAINRVVQPVVHRVFTLLKLDYTKTIRKILFEIPDYSQKKYKNAFTDLERLKIDNNESSREFDITFLYKLLQRICGLADTNSSEWGDAGTLENDLKQLKEHRNVLAHEELSLTNDELQEKIRDMEELCRNTLIKTGLLKKQDLTTDIDTMEKGMEEVLLGNIDLWEPYKEALNKLRLEQTTVLTREGRKDIQRIGKALKVLNPFSWLLDSKYSHLDVEHVFTELSIEGENNIEMFKLLGTKLCSGDSPDVFVVSGTPGIGKTSLFRFLVHDWLCLSKRMLGMENFDFVIPVELRHVCSNNIRDLLENHLLHNVAKHLKPDEIISALKDISVLWLLDGYDEASVKTREVIKELLQNFPNSLVVITTRTEFTQEIIDLCSNHVHRSHLSVSLRGFTKSNVEECAKNLISVSVSDTKERDQKSKEFSNFWQERNFFQQSIFSTPLFVTIIVILWLDSASGLDKINTISAMYNLFVDHIIQKLLVRDSFVKLNKRKFVLEKKINQFFSHVGNVLWWKEFEFTLKEYEVEYLEEKCSQLDLPFTDTMSAFFVYAEVGTPTGVRTEYTVIHRTMADFMAARSFVETMISERWDVMTTAEHFFKAKRKTLLQYEPNHKNLRNVFDVENLSKDLPSDIFQKFHKQYLIMHHDAFFSEGENTKFCHICSCDKTDKISSDHYIQEENDGYGSTIYKRSHLLWCHVKEYLRGPWIMFLLGYMSVRGAIDESRGEQLAFIFCNLPDISLFMNDFFLSCIKETNNSLFTQKLCKYLKNITWVFHEDRGFSEAKELLNLVSPESVFLHHCKRFTEVAIGGGKSILHDYDPSQFLLKCADTFSRYPVKVYLDLRYFFHHPDQNLDFTKKCLNLLINETSQCQLISIRCCVDDDILRHLKNVSSIKEMSVKFLGEDLSLMASLVNTFEELRVFRLGIDPCRYARQNVSAVRLDNAKISKTSIMLTDIFSVSPEELASLLKNLCQNPSHVILKGRISHFDDVAILTYIAWVFVKVRPRRLKIILDINESSYHYFTANYSYVHDRFRILRSFTKRLYSGLFVRLIFMHFGAPAYLIRNKDMSFSYRWYKEGY